MNRQTRKPLTPGTMFNEERLWQAWLDVEAELALAQAEMGMIPQAAAEKIAATADLDGLDVEALRRAIAETKAPVFALVRVLSEACGDSGGFVHWGATTQNVMQTGRLLLLREAHGALLAELARALEGLADLATEHAVTPMAGRTNRRHALPISFGYKVAGWIEELLRVDARFRDSEARVFSLSFGGAVGPMHSFGQKGVRLTEILASRLGLTNTITHNRVCGDTAIEYVVQLSLFAISVGRIADEIYLLMTEELDEIAERQGAGVVGSSTMPHKVNPKHVVGVSAKAALLSSKATAALGAGRPHHEGDAVANRILSLVLDEACPLAWELAIEFADLVGGIEVRTGSMLANLQRSADFIASEHLMMRLAGEIGRQRAHDVLHHAIAEAMAEGASIRERLHADKEIAATFDAETIDGLLAPEGYMGRSEEIATQAAGLGRQAANALRHRLQAPLR
ncbi:MAG: lyase family protein [Kiloniellaceae bacterium]